MEEVWSIYNDLHLSRRYNGPEPMRLTISDIRAMLEIRRVNPDDWSDFLYMIQQMDRAMFAWRSEVQLSSQEKKDADA